MTSGGVGASGKRGGGGDGEAASVLSAAASSTTCTAAPPRPPLSQRLHAPGISSLSSSASLRHMRTLSSDDGDDERSSSSASTSASTSSSSSSSSPSSFRISLPCRAALTGGSRGRPDLRIRLFELKAGAALEEGGGGGGGGGGRATTLSRRRRQGRRQGGGANTSDAASEVLDLAARAGALVYFRLACSSSDGGGLAPAAIGALAAVGALRAAAAPLLSSPRGKRLLSSGLQSCSGAPTAATARAAVGAALDWVDQFAPPSLLLACAGALVALAHPPSAAALRAAAAMAPVAAAYASTSRDAALGRIPETDGALEEAWRRRHRAAALRLAPFMSDLAEVPPLGWAADLAERATAGAAASSSASSFPGSSLASVGQWGAGGGDGGGLLWISFPLPGGGGRRRRREREGGEERQRAAVGAAAAAAAAAAKAPPSPLLLPRSSKPLSRRRRDSEEEEEEESVREMLSMASTDDEEEQLLLSPTTATATTASAAASSPKKKKMRRPSPWAAARSLASSSSSPSSSSGSGTSSGISSGTGGTDLVLFGGGDHDSGESGSDHHSRALTPADRVALASRAAHLALVFLPFLLLAPALLVFAAALEARRRRGEEEEEREGNSDGDGGERRLMNNNDNTTAAASRRARALAWSLLLSSIRASGPAFIKWGQWSATREDMFPTELCEALSSLHDAAPRHGWKATRAIVERAFGGRLEDHFASFEEEPIASGSIAQVHRAVLKLRQGGAGAGGAGGGLESPVIGLLPVAVKVRHPNVARRIATDFRLLKPLAAAASRVRGLRGFSLQQSLAQFSATMTAQADLRVEAAHLRRMRANFAAVEHSVTLPAPVAGYDGAAGCLVESFERGESVAAYMRKSAPGAASFNPQIVALGVDAYLKMLLHDNFVHTDLHPGNIMVRVRDFDDEGDSEHQHPNTNSSSSSSSSPSPPPQHHRHQTLESLSSSEASAARGRLQLVLLDLGLAEELTLPVRTVFISLLNAIAAGDGRAGARLMLRMSARQRCADPLAFERDMVLLFKEHADVRAPGGIDLDAVLKGALRAARAHEVSIDSGFAALVVGVCVIVGFARALDPNTNLMDAATPSLLAYNLTGRAMGRLYS